MRRSRVGASIRLRRSRSASKQRPSTADGGGSWRSRKDLASTALDIELERDAAGDGWGRVDNSLRAPARGTHPGAAANRSRSSKAARSKGDATLLQRPSTADGTYGRAAPGGLEPTVGALEPEPEPQAEAGGGHPERTNSAPSDGFRSATRVRQRRHRQELLEAVEEGNTTEVEVLLRFGTPVRDTRCEHLDSSLLHTAALFGYRRICELLIEFDAEVNAADASMETPLMWAAKWGHAEICRMLLENGALLHLRCGIDGLTAMDKASADGHPAVVEAMQSYDDESRAFVDKIFNEIDADGSGEIDKEELGEYVLRQRADHSLVLGEIEQQLRAVRSKLEEESDAHLQAQQHLAEVSAAYETAAENAKFWEDRNATANTELKETRAALEKVEQRAVRLAEKNAKHDSIVSDVQASAQIAIKAASHAVASALNRPGSSAGMRPTTTESVGTAAAGGGGTEPLKPPLAEGRRWSVSAGGPAGAGAGLKRPSSADGEEWHAIASFVQHRNRALPLPAGLLQTIMQQVDEVLQWIKDGGASELADMQRSASPKSQRRQKSPANKRNANGTTKSGRAKSPKSPGRWRSEPDDEAAHYEPVLPWIVERLSQAQAAGKSLRMLLEEADIPLPVREQERLSRRVDRLVRGTDDLTDQLTESRATGERWTARALAAEARAARAEANAADLELKNDVLCAEVGFVRNQKREAVKVEVLRQRELEAQLSMQAERVRLANLRANAASQERSEQQRQRQVPGESGFYEYDPRARLHEQLQVLQADKVKQAPVVTKEENATVGAVAVDAGRGLFEASLAEEAAAAVAVKLRKKRPGTAGPKKRAAAVTVPPIDSDRGKLAIQSGWASAGRRLLELG